MGGRQKDGDRKSLPYPDYAWVNLGSGWRQPTQEFGLYGEAFHRAAKQLTQTLAENHAQDPFDTCPIVFLYRHATELYLKGILRVGEPLLGMLGMQPQFDASSFTSHPLRPLLKPLRELFEAMDWAESYEEVSSFVEPLDEMDPNSFAFRYPVDKEDTSALSESFVFNILAFAHDADACLRVLYNATYSLDDRLADAKRMLSDSAGYYEEGQG